VWAAWELRQALDQPLLLAPPVTEKYGRRPAARDVGLRDQSDLCSSRTSAARRYDLEARSFLG